MKRRITEALAAFQAGKSRLALDLLQPLDAGADIETSVPIAIADCVVLAINCLQREVGEPVTRVPRDAGFYLRTVLTLLEPRENARYDLRTGATNPHPNRRQGD